MNRNKRRLTVSLSEDLVEVLMDLADRGGSTMTDEIKKAIQDRKYFVDKIASGSSVMVVEDGMAGGANRTLVNLD